MREGLVVGLIAYVAVAVFYVGFDILAARGALFTVNMLGEAVFRGLRDPSVLRFPRELDPTAIFLYNALHLALSLGIGLTVTWLVAVAERYQEWRGAVLAVLFTGGVVTVMAVGLLTEAMRPVLPWWSIVVANLLAVAIAGAYLVRRHPTIIARSGSLATVR